MSTMWPKRLKAEPLIDAICEIRFKPKAPASNILPGVLFDKLPGEKSIGKLPAADLPEQVRATDPNLKFAPMIKVEWGNYIILISDSSVAIGSPPPYQGWTSFKSAIIKVFEILRGISIVDSVDRVSIKYVDLIERKTIEEQISSVNLDVKVGKNEIKKENLRIRAEVFEDNLIHIINILTSAQATSINGGKKLGLVVDIDTVLQIEPLIFDDFLELFKREVDLMHGKNVDQFFSCLTEETIKSLEPVYD